MKPSGPPLVRKLREAALTASAIAGVVCILATLAGLLLAVRPVVFRSGSMAPTIPTGALAFSRMVPATQLHRGDVVTVRTSTGVNVTHRIQDISLQRNQATLVLKGDANRVPDDHAYVVTQARRVLFSVRGAGYVVTWMSSSAGVFLGGLVVGGAVLVLLRPSSRAPEGNPTSRVAVAGAVVALGVGGATVGGTSSTLAYYTDTASLTGGTFTRPASPPVITSCTVGNGNSITATISWTFPTNPATFEVRYNNGTAAQDFAGTLRSGTLVAPMNNLSGEFWMVAIGSDGSVSSDSGHYAFSGKGGNRTCAPA